MASRGWPVWPNSFPVEALDVGVYLAFHMQHTVADETDDRVRSSAATHLCEELRQVQPMGGLCHCYQVDAAVGQTAFFRERCTVSHTLMRLRLLDLRMTRVGCNYFVEVVCEQY